MPSLSEQYIYKKLIQEALSMEDMKKLGDALENIKKIIGNVNLPSVKSAIDKASNEFADIGRSIGQAGKENVIKGLLTKGRAGVQKVLKFAELSALRIMLSNLLRELPKSIKTLSGTFKISNEAIIREQPRDLGSPAPVVDKSTEGEPDIVSRTAGRDKGNIQQLEPKKGLAGQGSDINDIIDAIIQGNIGPDLDPKLTLGLVLGNEAGKAQEIFADLADPQRAGAAGKVSGLFSMLQGGKTPFGLDPKQIAADLMQVPIGDLAGLVKRASESAGEVEGMSSDDIAQTAKAAETIRKDPRAVEKRAEEEAKKEPGETAQINVGTVAKTLRRYGANERSVRAITRYLNRLSKKGPVTFTR